MNLFASKNSFFIALCLGFAACESGPKTIESEPTGQNSAAPTGGSAVDAALGGSVGQAATPAAEAAPAGERSGKAKSFLHTEKYTYVEMDEAGQTVWVAIPKANIEVGATYFFSGGLLKANFQSREHNRVFDKIWLIPGLSKTPSGGAAAAATTAPMPTAQAATTEPPTQPITAKGAVRIADLMGNLAKYDGKTIRVTGKVMKVNPMIMGRNWLHLQDGSANNFDLTVTTMEQFQVGQTATLEGTVALNKDFGAGYRYNVIVEGAKAAN